MKLLVVLLASAAGCACRPLPLDEAPADFAARQDISPSVDLTQPHDLAVAVDLAPAIDLAPAVDLAPLVEVRLGWPDAGRRATWFGGGSVLVFAFALPSSLTLEGLGLLANEAGGRVRMAIYQDEAGQPGALIADTPARAVEAPGAVEWTVAPRTLAAGSYWLGLRGDGAPLLSDEATQRCSRIFTLGKLDDPWPASFGAASCAMTPAPNLYLVGRVPADGDLGLAPAVDLGSAGEEAIGWPSPLPSPQPVPNASVIAYPIDVPAQRRLDGYGLIAASEGGDFKLALYDDAAGQPGNLVSSTVLRRRALAGENRVDVFDQPLDAGRYWLAIRASPSVSVSSGGDERATLCSRNITIASLDTGWPERWGATRCQERAPLTLFVSVAR